MPDPASLIPGKSDGLVIHDAEFGLMETPLAELRRHAITPTELLFTRGHNRVDGGQNWFNRLAPPPPEIVDTWRLRIGGLTRRPVTLSIADLKRHPQEERVAVLQCAGNGRVFYAARQQTEGDPWQRGAMANLEWEGVPLRLLLDQLGVAPDPSAKWPTAAGWRVPDERESDYEKSCPLDHPALDHAILALTLNGEPVPAVHGGPLRLVIPGFYGSVSVKMLTALLFTDKEADNKFQALEYRMPVNLPADPASFGVHDYNTRNSTPSLAHKIKSVIFSPLPDDKIASGEIVISGVAFNDGLSKITRVEVSTDAGTTWQVASIRAAASPWAWHHWTLRTTLGPGRHQIVSRASDASGDSQPLDGQVRWNPRGYEWNGADRVDIAV